MNVLMLLVILMVVLIQMVTELPTKMTNVLMKQVNLITVVALGLIQTVME